MTDSNDNHPDSSREEFLLDLQEGHAHMRPYSEEEAAVTELWQMQHEQPEWIVVLGGHDRRLLTAAQVLSGLRTGELQSSMSAWRRGMPGWSPLACIAELTPVAEAPITRCQPPRRASPPALRERPPAKASAAALDLDLDEAASALGFDHEPGMRVKRAVMGLSALTMFGVFVTMFIISSAREDKSSANLDSPQPISTSLRTSPAEMPSAGDEALTGRRSALPTSAAALLAADDDARGLPGIRATREQESRSKRF